jgi:hypothetical protein
MSIIQTVNYLSINHPNHQLSEPLPVKKVTMYFPITSYYTATLHKIVHKQDLTEDKG